MLLEQPYTVIEGTVGEGIQLINRLSEYDFILYRMQKNKKQELELIKTVSEMLKEDGMMVVVSNHKEELYVVNLLFKEAGYVTTLRAGYVCISKVVIHEDLPKKLSSELIYQWVKKVASEGRVLEVNAENASIPIAVWQQKKEDSKMSFLILKENQCEEAIKGLPYLMRQGMIFREKVTRICLD